MSMRTGNIGQVRPMDIANGEGIRCSVFVTGCTHACEGCFNLMYQDFKAGEPWTQNDYDTVVGSLKNPCVAGLTLIGGEPFQNLWLIDLVKKWRAEGLLEPPKNVWAYSGYTWEEIVSHTARKRLLLECDVLVDGKFVLAQRDLKLKFRGSANQRIIDVKKSLEADEVIPYYNNL